MRLPLRLLALSLLAMACVPPRAHEVAAPPPAPPPPACDSPAAREFDFWIGEWTIRQRILAADGGWHELDARTTVEPTLDGCALVEHWRGDVQFFWQGMERPEPMRGLSVRAFDPATGKWAIHWMDTRTPSFGAPYVGGFDGGRGEFFRDWTTPAGERRGRITFSGIEENAVDWELAISSDGGESWSALWTMAMRRAGT
jgi:hypothetical protein